MTDLLIGEVFLSRAQGVAHLMRDRVWRMIGASSSEPMRVELIEGEGGPTLRYRLERDTDGCVEIGAITPAGIADVRYEAPVPQNSVPLASSSREVDNRKGVAAINLKFAEFFGHTDTRSESHKVGGSVQVQIKSSQKIAGSVSFDEAVTATATTEFASSAGSADVHNVTGEESTSVPVGKRVRLFEEISRSDLVIPVTARGKFSHTFGIGKHSGGHWKGGHGRGYGWWESWEDFRTVVAGDAPDNWDFATSMREHPPWTADLWALKEIDAPLEYEVTLTGATVAAYRAEEF